MSDRDDPIAKVEIFNGATLLATLTREPYAFIWSAVPAGTYDLTAKATDSLGATGKSNIVRARVRDNAAPHVRITVPSNNASFAAPATIAVAIRANDPDDNINRVELLANGASIASFSAPPYDFNWAKVAAGTYVLTARATDDLGLTTTSQAVTVSVTGASNQPPTVSIKSPASGAVFNAPATVTILATAADSDGKVLKVDFFQGATPIGTATDAPYSASVANLAAGSYSFTAVATDSSGGATTSAAVAITVSAAEAKLYYIHTDHLNSPRRIYNQAQQLVWLWENTEPFGDSVPNENPNGLGTFTCNLRFPGTYADTETGTLHNWHRTLAPALGRYHQSDPIGLEGGINTYLYVLANPLSYIDPLGLDVNVCFYADAAAGFGHVGYGFLKEPRTKGFYPTGNPLESPGIVKVDTQQQQVCKVIESPPDKDNCMRRCQARRENDPGTYYLTYNQCTSFVRDCLKECGLPYGNYPGPKPKPFFQSLPGK